MTFAATDFIALAGSLMASKGNLSAAAEFAAHHRSSERVQMVLKTAVSAGSLADAGWAANLGGSALVGGFLESLQSLSVFDALLAGGMMRIPLRTRAVSVTTAATGYVAGEGAAKPISKLALGSGTLDPIKAEATIVMSAELATQAASGASGFFGGELRRGVASATDLQFIAGLVAGTSPIPSSGTDADAYQTDMAALMASVSPRANSRLFVIMDANLALTLSLTRGTGGELVFPGLSYRGGELQRDLPVLVSDQCVAGVVILVDATGLAGNSDTVMLDGSAETTLQMDDAPTQSSVTPTATTVVNLFMTNARALRAERWFGFEIVRASAVAALTEVDWFSTGGSDS